MDRAFSLLQPVVLVRPVGSDISGLALAGSVSYDRRRVGLGVVEAVSASVPDGFAVKEGMRVVYHMGLVRGFPAANGDGLHAVYWFDVEAVVPDGVRVDVDF